MTPPIAEHDQVEDITGTMPRKLRAIRCYRPQLAGFRYDRAARGLNQYRGVLSGRCRYVEPFQSATALPNPSLREKPRRSP
jgi:hypothetical protein